MKRLFLIPKKLGKKTKEAIITEIKSATENINNNTKYQQQDDCNSIITLNINGPNYLIKRHKLDEWTTKQKLSICCLHEDSFRDRQHLSVQGRTKISNQTRPRSKKMLLSKYLKNGLQN